MSAHEQTNCIDIVRPFIHAVSAEGIPPIQLMGGIGSVALLDPRTVYISDEHRIVAPSDLRLDDHRQDGNLRDLDTLVLSSDEDDLHLVEAIAGETIGSRLVTEVFDLKDIAKIAELVANPLGKRAVFNTFLSDRYVPKTGIWTVDGPTPQRVLFPFSAPIENETLETWILEVGDDLEIPVPAPGTVILNYLTRSISGLRTKDKTKVDEMASSIFRQLPESLDWIVDGPGKSQFELARIFYSLRQSAKHTKELILGGKLKLSSIEDSQITTEPAFMFREAPAQLQRRLLRLAQIKSHGLHAAESLKFIVKPYQKYIEPRLRSITHND